MKMENVVRKKGSVLFILVLLLVGVIMMSTAQMSANESDPFLWPYNQPTNISFNENDVYQAWVNWRNAQITANNAGGNGRLRVMGGVDGNSTVSEGMGYGILFASIFDEQTTLDGLYLFARDHFNERGVMHWHIGNPGELIGEGGATDAEVDMALGLVNACVKVQQGSWSASPAGIDYCNEATNLINAIYTHEVDHPGDTPEAGLPNNPGDELIPGDSWFLQLDYPEGIINLSYFPPGYFEVFGKFTNNEAAWNAVINRNYAVVDLVQAKPDNCSGLVPNWNQYDGDAQLVSWQPNNYSWWSYDAARFAWRIAVDQAWYGRSQAAETMNEIGGFFSSSGFNNIGEHRMNGQRAGGGPWPFFVANAGAAVWAAPNPTPVTCGTATGTLQESPQSAYNRVLNTSDNPNSYYGNAWRLFAMLLMTGNFPNFYEMAATGPATATPVVPTNTPVGPLPTATTTATPTSGGICEVDYAVINEWSNAFQAMVVITNNSSNPISGWTLEWQHAPGQTVLSAWNATVVQIGNDVTASNPAGHWNGTIGANGGTVSFGFTATHNGGAVIPTQFVLNGMACNGFPVTPLPPTITTTPPAGDLPDLIVSDITYNPGTPQCGSHPPDLGVRVWLENIGTANAGSFVVELNGFQQQTVSGLAAGAETSILFSGITSQATAVVDATSLVIESNEANNSLTQNLPIPTLPPPCTPTPTAVPPTATATPTAAPPTATPTATATPGSGGSCTVDYTFVNQWDTGFQVDIRITNNGSAPIAGYTLAWEFPGNEDFQIGWNATFVENGSAMTASNPAGHWNGTIGANGGSVLFGFIAYHNGNYGVPAVFTLNGVVCN